LGFQLFRAGLLSVYVRVAMIDTERAQKRARTDDVTREGSAHVYVDLVRIKGVTALAHPMLIMEEYPASPWCVQIVQEARSSFAACIEGRDDRLVVIVGPSTIHDPQAALEFARRLQAEAERHRNELLVLMRVAFANTGTRTSSSWKGLVHDPYLDGSFKANDGLRIVRKLLRDINNLGVPCGCAFLDTLTPQYISDLVSHCSIDPSATECQTLRELASGLSMPVGFKKRCTGSFDPVIDAMVTSRLPHQFFSISKQGTASNVCSKGNSSTHAVLQGQAQPHVDTATVQASVDKLKENGCLPRVMIDCAHGHSQENFKDQVKVISSISEQYISGVPICGVMFESNLFEGRQDIPSQDSLPCATASSAERQSKNVVLDSGLLRYGVSVTDSCVGWAATAEMIETLASAVRTRRTPALTTGH